MIIYGGFRYVTSAGDSSKITAARQTIMYALVGLVVVALSQLLVKFVLNASSEAIAPTAQLNTQQILPSVNNYDINLVS
jgi:Tfp pilus assembly protein PilN